MITNSTPLAKAILFKVLFTRINITNRIAKTNTRAVSIKSFETPLDATVFVFAWTSPGGGGGGDFPGEEGGGDSGVDALGGDDTADVGGEEGGADLTDEPVDFEEPAEEPEA